MFSNPLASSTHAWWFCCLLFCCSCKYAPSNVPVFCSGGCRELGFLWVSEDGSTHSLALQARAGLDVSTESPFIAQVLLDGAPVPLPTPGSPLTLGVLSLEAIGFGKHGPYDMDQYRLTLPGLLSASLKLRAAHPLLQTPDDAFIHFNMHLESFQASPHVHGVLGQTFRNSASQMVKALEYQLLTQLLRSPVAADGSSGNGFLEGQPSDYEVSSILSPSCKFSAFSEK